MTKYSLRNTVKWMLVCLLLFMMAGCGHILDSLDLHDETVYPAATPIDNPAPPKSHGTIYQSGHEISLYEDHIAGRTGDILTIRLEEATQGEKNANMKTTKNTLEDTNNGTGNGQPGSSVQPIMFGGAVRAFNFNTGSEINFEGKGATNESNKLHGTISVTVTRVLSNGNLTIQGESWITINQGREYIRLTGIVRREDVEPGNIVSSQRIADARISYTGSGQVGGAARGGFITQLLTKYFPF